MRSSGVPIYGGSQEVTAERGWTTTPVTIELAYIGPTSQVSILPAGNAGIGRIVSTPEGIDCAIQANLASGSSAAFPTGTSIQLVPSTTTFSGFNFSGWSDACSGTRASCTIVATGPSVSVSSAFAYDPCLFAPVIIVSSTVSGDIATSDCQFASGQFAD